MKLSLLVAGTVAAAQSARVSFFKFVPYQYSAVLPVILAVVVASWIALQSLKTENPDLASAVRFQTLAEAIPRSSGSPTRMAARRSSTKRWYEMTETNENDALWHPGPNPFIPMRNACARARLSKSNTGSTMRPTVIAGISIGPSLFATIRESSRSGLEPALTLRSRSTINRCLSSRSRSARRNWPTPIPACSRRYGKKTSPADA